MKLGNSFNKRIIVRLTDLQYEHCKHACDRIHPDVTVSDFIRMMIDCDIADQIRMDKEIEKAEKEGLI